MMLPGEKTNAIATPVVLDALFNPVLLILGRSTNRGTKINI